MFIRESEGVYKFGQKRIYVKVEKGDKIFVRVGGGFMSIEEFIYQYTPEETEKIMRFRVSEFKELPEYIVLHAELIGEVRN